MRQLSEGELAIAAMENLEAVRFYNLMETVRGGDDGQMLALMVLYGDGKYFNCTQSDAEFGFLLQRTLDRYHLEKSRRAIDVDDLSRRILEKGRVDVQRSMAAFYQGKRACGEPLLDYAETRFPEIADIVYDQLRIIHGLRGERLTVRGFSGQKGKIAVRAAVDGAERMIPLSVRRESAFSWRVSMGNLLGAVGGVKLETRFGNNRLEVAWHTADGRLRMEAAYRVSDRGLHIREELMVDGELRYQRAGDAREPVGPEEREPLLYWLRMDGGLESEPELYRLPWGGYLGHSAARRPLGDRCVAHTGQSLYLLPGEDYVILRQYGEKGLSAPDGSFYIETDGLMKAVNIHFAGGYGVMETTFGYHAGALGSYKRELQDKSFYHVLRKGETELLPSEEGLRPGEGKLRPGEGKLRPVVEADHITGGYQLLDAATLEAIWKGRVRIGGIV